MDLYSLNDYELIYMIRDYDEFALDLLFAKYNGWIFKKINEFNIKGMDRDDFFMEAQMCLFEAVRKYKEEFNVCFFNFFNIIITRRFIKLRNELSYDIYTEMPELYVKEDYSEYLSRIYYELGYELLKSDEERLIYKELYMLGSSPKEISKLYNINIKRIYNIIQKIKRVLQSIKY